MPSITFEILEDGLASLTIKGEKGIDACKPIHDAISKDLSAILSIPEMKVEETPEAQERPPEYTTVNTARARR